jgi:hypothetical protein
MDVSITRMTIIYHHGMFVNQQKVSPARLPISGGTEAILFLYRWSSRSCCSGVKISGGRYSILLDPGMQSEEMIKDRSWSVDREDTQPLPHCRAIHSITHSHSRTSKKRIIKWASMYVTYLGAGARGWCSWLGSAAASESRCCDTNVHKTGLISITIECATVGKYAGTSENGGIRSKM